MIGLTGTIDNKSASFICGFKDYCVSYEYTFLHARPWIPGDEKSIFTVVIH